MLVILVLVLMTWWTRSGEPFLKEAGVGSPVQAPSAVTPSVKGDYQVLRGARLISHRSNDGDSFHISHDGRDYEMRLYYVDCPEKYIAKHNAKRLGHQARYFGGIGLDEAVGVGLEAREFTRGLLEEGSFEVFTRWEGVYGNERHYCFVILRDGTHLSELLVEEGLARIYTKGEPTPDGRKVKEFKKHLKELEYRAKKAARGAWGINAPAGRS